MNTADFTNNVEEFEAMINERAYHIYECESCVLVFAVEQAFEDQSIITCPSCKDDNWIRDRGYGVMKERNCENGL